MKRLSLIVITLALLLAACGGNEATGPTTKPQPSAPIKAISQENLSKSVRETGTISLELGKALADDDITVALTNLPTNNPVGNFMSPTEMVNLARPNLKASTANFSTLAVMDAFELERGIYTYNETTYEWKRVGESDDFEGSWSFENGASVSRAKVVIDWDASAPTQIVSDGANDYEVPTGMNALMTIDGQKASDLDTELGWYSSAGCNTDIYQPTRVKVDGFVGVSDKVMLDDVHYEISDTAGTDTIRSAGKISAVAGADSGNLSWDISLNAQLEEDAYCYLSGFDKVTDTDISFAYDVSADGATNGLEFGVNVSDINAEQASLVLSNGYLDIIGEGRLEFAGKLDDANQNGVPGENVTLTFAKGQTMTLEAYIQDDFMTAAYVVRQLKNVR